MAGRGPAPKDPAIRQRRNKIATAATLPAEGSPAARARKIKALGPHPNGARWHVRTREWWLASWRSIVSEKYLHIDMHRLQMVAVIVDDFWKAKTMKERREAHQEVRLALAHFGQTALDRWRLSWSIHEEPAPGATLPVPPTVPTKPRSSPTSAADDPRNVLKMVPRTGTEAR